MGFLALRKMHDSSGPGVFPTRLSQAAPPWGVGVGPQTPARPLGGLDILSVSMWPRYLVDVTVQRHVEFGEVSDSKTSSQPDLL